VLRWMFEEVMEEWADSISSQRNVLMDVHRLPYHIGVSKFRSHSVILRSTSDLQSDLYYSSRKVMNKNNLAESCLKNRLQVPFPST